MPRKYWLFLISTIFIVASLAIYIESIGWQQFINIVGFGEEIVTQESVERSGSSSGSITSVTSTKRIEPGRDFWNFLELFGTLAIPLLLVYIGDSLQRRNVEIAETNLRETALQGYLDRIAELMLSSEINTLEKDDSRRELIQDIMRTKTLTILRSLGADRERKGSVIRFLTDANLIRGYIQIDLSSANLSDADLSGIDLSRALLKGADLSNANLSNAELSNAQLDNANLFGANLTSADLTSAFLRNANLTKANLSEAEFSSAKINNADFRGVRGKGRISGLTEKQLSSAKNF